MTIAHGIAGTTQALNIWNLDLTVLSGIAVVGILYGFGSTRLLRSETFRRRRVIAFYAGLALLGGAISSPLAHLAHELFSAHMVQHLALMLAAAPLLVYGSPRGPVLVALPASVRSAAGHVLHGLRPATRFIRNPMTVWVLNTIVLWAWHMPPLYEAALRNEALHAVEHLSFLAVSFLFWSLVISGTRRRVGHAATLMLVFGTALQSGGLGAVLTFATAILYPVHAVGVAAYGLVPLADQQLAGVVMWVPGGILYFMTMAVLLLRWLKALEKSMPPSRRQSALRVEGGEP